MPADEDLQPVVTPADGPPPALAEIDHGLCHDGFLGDSVLEDLLRHPLAAHGQLYEVRLHPAGGDLQDRDPSALQFDAEGLAEAPDEGLGCGVDVQTW